MLYFLHTIPGLGPLAWQEAETRLPTANETSRPGTAGIRLVPGRNDIVLVRYSGDARALLRLRVSEDVFVVAARAFNVAPDAQGLRQMYAAVRESQFVHAALAAWKKASGARRAPTTFRVVAREVGAHRFRRRDMGQAVADAVKAGWPGRWRQVDEGADVEIWATLLERELLCGVRLSGPEMRQRDKVRHMPAALRPALAAAMVLLTEPMPDDVFLDPLAGTGTLLVERAAAGPFRQIYGGDNSAEMVKTMRINTRGLQGDVRCERWDARALPLPAASVDSVAVNLPFGKQVAAAEDLAGLYRAVLVEIERVLRPGGRLVALVGDIRVLDAARVRATPHLRPDARQRVTLLGMAASMCVFVKQP